MNKTVRRKVFGFPPSYEKFGFLNPQILFEELERIVGDVNKAISSIMKISNQDVEFNCLFVILLTLLIIQSVLGCIPKV